MSIPNTRKPRWGEGVEHFPTPPGRVPADNYRDPERLKLEIERMFRLTWLVGGHATEIPNPGDFKVWERFGETVVISRLEDGGYGAFHNVCKHRGARIVRSSGRCAGTLQCRWHGWRYDLKGDLVNVPKRPDFDEESQLAGLHADRVAVQEWNGIIWINLAGPDKAPPLLEYMDELVPELEPFNVGAMKPFHHQIRIFKANWKAVLDGFNEAYHGATTHKTFDDEKIWDLDKMSVPIMGKHDAFILPFRDTYDEIERTNDHHAFATCHYSAFPNAIYLANKRADTCNLMIAWPVDVGTTQFEFYLLGGPNAELEPAEGEPTGPYREHARTPAERAAFFNSVLDEDSYAMEESGATMRSMAWKENLTNLREGRVVHLQQEIQKYLDGKA